MNNITSKLGVISNRRQRRTRTAGGGQRVRSGSPARALAVAVFAAAVGAFASSERESRAGTSTNTAGPVRAGQVNGGTGSPSLNFPAISISLSGQTAFNSFTTSLGYSTLQPGTSINLTFWTLSYSGTTPTYTTAARTFTANLQSPSVNVQLAKRSFNTADVGVDYSSGVPDVQSHSALRIEWHEQGSAQGFYDLLNDQVGYAGGFSGTPLSNVASRGPSISNRTWVNGTAFTAGGTSGGHPLDGANYGNTYDIAAFNPTNFTYDARTGKNLKGGQDRVQVAIGEFRTENLARKDSPSTVGNVFRIPGADGYGLGNPKLPASANLLGLGNGGGRQQFRPATDADLSTDKIDPNSHTGATYAAGPWNNASFDNIQSIQYGVTAVTFAANPGTGLLRINRGDAQFLQTLGRLRNGADFNTVSRGNDAGQRTVPALSTGVDPSWAVGENDDGNTSGDLLTNVQKSLGAGFRFSGKTAGGEARNAIAQSRLGVGPLSLLESRGANSRAPVRALDVDFTNNIDPLNPADSRFFAVNFDNIASFNYRAVLISHYNVVKAPRTDLLAAYRTNFFNGSVDPSGTATPGAPARNAFPTPAEERAWWAARTVDDTGIKGDPYGNTLAFIRNITNSVGTATAGLNSQPASISNPADALFANGFLVPGLLDFRREFDGGPLTPQPLTPDQRALRDDVKANYGAAFSTAGTAGSNNQTKGVNALYGFLNATGAVPGAAPVINGDIPITAKNAAGVEVGNGDPTSPRGNHLFGNFNQNGSRDFSAVKTGVGAALALTRAELAATTPGLNSIYTVDGGLTNPTAITNGFSGSPGWSTSASTKGDLIVLGDANSDARFDGKDLYFLARGAALSDSGSESLGALTGASFADRVRNPRARLNKNAALDFTLAQTAPLTTDDGLNAARARLRSSARVELTGAAGQTLPAGATLVSQTGSGPTLVVTYTWDPSGLLAFDKRDVNRDGRLNLDDALALDSVAGLDYQNLLHSLSATVAVDGTSDIAKTQRQFSIVDAKLVDTDAVAPVGTETFATADPDSPSSVALRAIKQADADVLNVTFASGSLSHGWSQNNFKTGTLNLSAAPSTASVTVPSGATLAIAAGSFSAGGAVDLFADTAVPSRKLAVVNNASTGLRVASGSHSLRGLSGTGSVVVSAGGVLVVDPATVSTSGPAVVAVAQSGASVAGTLRIAPSDRAAGRPYLSVLDSVSIAPGGFFDLTNNDAVIRNGDLNALRAAAATWWNNGTRNGTGLGTSALARGLPSAQWTTLAVFPNNTGFGFPAFSTFAGLSVSATDVLVKYTYLGDTDLSGTIDARDLARVLNGWSNNLTGWQNGDTNYDGVINAADYVNVLNAFNNQGAPLTFDPAPASAIPEPAVLSFFVPAALALRRRRA